MDRDEVFAELQQILDGQPTSGPEEEKPRMLTDMDIQTIILALAEARGDEGFTEDEVVAAVRWAEMATISWSFLKLLLRGLVTIDDPTGTFKDPEFSLSEVGRRYVENMS